MYALQECVRISWKCLVSFLSALPATRAAELHYAARVMHVVVVQFSRRTSTLESTVSTVFAFSLDERKGSYTLIFCKICIQGLVFFAEFVTFSIPIVSFQYEFNVLILSYFKS